MNKSLKIKESINHYIVLAAILGTGYFLFTAYRFNQQVQVSVIIITALFYVVWGIFHHKLVHYINRDIILEYILVAVLGSLVMISLINP